MLLTREDLPRLGITISPSTLLRLEAAGQFPKRIRLGHHSVAWWRKKFTTTSPSSRLSETSHEAAWISLSSCA
jgi:hypothetical protein